jgi:hypothetical protein
MSATSWIATDGGPLILIPAAKRLAWHGSFVPGRDGDFAIETSRGPFAFRTDYDFENPRTDYERACGINGLVGHFLLLVERRPLFSTTIRLRQHGDLSPTAVCLLANSQ